MKYKKPLISVIVPVYNVEKHLVYCLDSLCRQNLRNIEIILVDDDSPDRCGDICEEYLETDARFKVIHHSENRGLSAARNTGIANASSDYLMFVDSDDQVHEDFCRLPYECAVKYQADLVMFAYRQVNRVKSSGKSIIGGKQLDIVLRPSGFMSQIEALELLRNGAGQVAWNKLYHKDLFKDVSYPEGFLYEDVGTTYKTILKASSIYWLDKILYYHFYHEGSITTLKTERVLQDWITMDMQQYQDLKAWGYPPDKLEFLFYTIALGYCIKKKNNLLDTRYAFFTNELRSCKEIPSGFTWKRKFMFVLMKYCPDLFELACRLLGRKYG